MGINKVDLQVVRELEIFVKKLLMYLCYDFQLTHLDLNLVVSLITKISVRS